jgi:hypothetical protein
MDKAEFEALMANVGSAPSEASAATAQPGSPAPAAPTSETPVADPSTAASDGSGGGTSSSSGDGLPADISPTLSQNLKAMVQGMKPENDPAYSALPALTSGMAEGIFNSKDFLFGTTPPDERSEFRQSIDQQFAKDTKSPLGGLMGGLGQFTIGMLGAGKLTAAAEALPWFGAGVKAAVTNAPKTVEALKAAWAGATAFDPHGSRLSNMVQDTTMANPINAWLAAKPGDTEAEGRIKNALESIGIDAAVGGVFIGATTIWKYLRAGDAAGAKAAAESLEKEIATNANSQPPQDAAPAQGNPGEGGPASSVAEQQAPHPAGDAGVGDAGGNPGGAQPVAPSKPTAAAEAISEPHPAALDGMPDRTLGQADAGAPRNPGGTVTAGDTGQVSRVSGPGEAAAKAGTQLPNPQPRIRLSQENTADLVQKMSDDAFAMEQFGGWYQAMQGGHTFGKGAQVPWQKLDPTNDIELQNFMARVTDTVESRIDGIKGGAVLTDKKVAQVASRMANLFNVDPASVIGMVQQAGKDAPKLTAMVETGWLVSNRLAQDTKALGARISLGDYTAYGSREAAMLELQKRASIAASVFASTKSMVTNAARTMRHQRFGIDPAIADAITKGVDAETLLKLVNGANDAKDLAKALSPTLLKRITDYAQFLLVNNLVSGPKTQLINLTTNAYMLGVRPLERILGATYMAARGQAGASRVYREAIRQYVYMGTNFTESWKAAVDAFVQNDSVLAPHRSEVHTSAGLAPVDLQQGLMGLKPMTSPQALAANAGKIATLGIGLPTRSLGFVDELMKQITYRSKVSASAYTDGVENALSAGLKGQAATDYVKGFVNDRISSAFNENGAALDKAALREAQISTFQQELLPNSIGKDLQTFASKHPGLRLMIPFIKTPTNVMRYGWKMTPGLNMLQTEFREALGGVHGAEAKANAIGQMTMGMLFMGTAAYMVSQGNITGGGPSDPKAKAALMATGWQPYSVVYENEDGSKTYVPFGRLDPVAIPMGMMADMMDAYHNIGEQESPALEQAAMGMLIAMSKQFTDKTYLQGINQMMQAMSDPDRSVKRVAGQMAANFIPYSAAQRQLNPDPYLHDAQTLVDKMRATVPGLSSSVPMKYDPFGQPIMRPGLWSSDDGQALSMEMQRLAIETGHTLETPSSNLKGVDLRTITMENGANAYEQYQKWAGNPGQGMSLATVLAKRIQSEAYQLLPDGDANTKGTKLWLLTGIASNYRERAAKMMRGDRNVRNAFRAAQLKAVSELRANIAARNARRNGGSLDALGDAFGADVQTGE